MSDVKAFDKADYGLHPRALRALGLPRLRLPRRRGARAARRARRPPRAARRATASTSGSSRAALEYEIARELEARRRELHGVLPPALGASVARQGLADGRPLPLAGPGQVRRLLHDADRGEHRRAAAGSACPRSTALDEDDAVSARFVWLFPNIALNVLPNHMFLLLVAARRGRTARRDAYLLTHPESRDAARRLGRSTR